MLNPFKISDMLTVELVCMIAGILGTGTLVYVLSNWDTLPAGFRELFRAGTIGGYFGGFCMIAGLASVALLFGNLCFGVRHYWYARIAGVFLLLLLTGMLGGLA